MITPSTAPKRPVTGLPHAADITHVAVTEDGEAALSSDGLDALRLWPRLDGSREPVPISSATAIAQLALLRDGTDFVAAVLDVAGSLQLIRIGSDGRTGARMSIGDRSLSADPVAFAEIVAFGSTLLVRTHDHAIEQYGLDGRLRGRVMANPGERLGGLAARHGRVAVIVSTTDGSSVRALDTDGALRWGMTSLRLPFSPIDGTLALAPGSRRFALVDAADHRVHVLDGNMLTEVPGSVRTLDAPHPRLAFIDDDSLALASELSLDWWFYDNRTGSMDRPTGALSADVGVADGRVIVGKSHELALSTPTRTRYLGWDVLANGAAMSLGDGLVLDTSSTHFTWLDASLKESGSYRVQVHDDAWAYGRVLDAHHLIVQRRPRSGGSSLEIIDTRTPDAPPTVVVRDADIVQYLVHDDILGVIADGNMRIFRMVLGDSAQVDEIVPAIHVGDRSLQSWQPLDPEKAGGLVAILHRWERDSDSDLTLTYFRKDGERVVTDRVRNFARPIVQVLRDGTLITSTRDRSDMKLEFWRDGKIVRELRRSTLASAPLAMDPDATRFAFFEGTDHAITVVDQDGHEIWTRPAWGARAAVFAGRMLAVSTPGGLLAFDAATGQPIGRACGYGFGLHDTPPDDPAFNAPPVCEDPIVP